MGHFHSLSADHLVETMHFQTWQDKAGNAPGIARLGRADFFDANTVITIDGADGLHLTAEAEKKLGTVSGEG